MHAHVADTVARTSRYQAVHDARQDLWELRARAVDAGRGRSRRIVKTSRIDPSTGELRYNPAGRLLRDWYMHVYLNTLRYNLGEPAVTIDAQQIEDTTRLLRRLRHSADGLAALRAVGMVRDTAVDDAAHATAGVVDHLATVAIRRAVLHAPDDRFDGDRLAIQVTRHWYQHCYNDHIHAATRSRHPLAEVTDAQQHQVARTLTSGEPRRIIGADGIPLLTAHGTVMSPTDRALADGLVGIISPITDTGRHAAEQLLSRQVTHTWTELSRAERAQWLRAAHAHRIPADNAWNQLPGETQSTIIRLYLDTHQPHQVTEPFRGAVIDADPVEAAMRMFNHSQPLADTTAGPDSAAGTRARPNEHDLLATAAVRPHGIGLST